MESAVTKEDLRLYELQRHIYTIASQIESLEREKRIKEITLEQLQATCPKPTVYQSMGRLFVWEDYDTLISKLSKEWETLGEQIRAKQNLKSQFEAKWESSRLATAPKT
ncbi:hypothetical protein GpartN1_g4346.t1 [Galdieria partita]|uniref:Prefoldin subunit n=1 Tax=Galdieria partita TaxID=83374 RepID=A0A9C7PY18_9RHOD|nr:hypothetical protein GpartN1_g4197.t1 [Galdieria partita]GJQ12555.1 hypothetical protein GpartN1_g4346.t1 [Galdieria partita]